MPLGQKASDLFELSNLFMQKSVEVAASDVVQCELLQMSDVNFQD